MNGMKKGVPFLIDTEILTNNPYTVYAILSGFEILNDALVT